MVWWSLRSTAWGRPGPRGPCGGFMRSSPHLVEEAPDPYDAGLAEVATFLKRPEEHEVHPERVRAPSLDVGVGDHDIPPRLRHLRAVFDDEPVSPELGERLVEVDVPELLKRHGHEARVKEMQHGVLIPADVGGHRQ